jgi:tRNA(Ile2) C34 agmatinyltransferase TiaS
VSTLQTLKTVLPGIETTDTDTTTYECQDCGNHIESAKDSADVRCLDCVSDDVEPV